MDDMPEGYELTERLLKRLYVSTSRRSWLVGIGRSVLKVMGVSMLPLLPVDRIVTPADAQTSGPCDYWFLCGIYGCVCDCSACGGTHVTCPSCATKSSGYWDECCLNAGQYWT